MPIRMVRANHIQEFLSHLLLGGNKSQIQHRQNYGKPLSNWTVQKIRSLLIASLRQAVKEKIVDYNYALDTDSIPTPRSANLAFSPEQQRLFLQRTRNHRYYAAYALLFFTGCRRSEILGLSWENVSYRESCIRITQTLVAYNNGALLKKRTKTEASIRVIPITKEMKELLHELQKRQKSERANVKQWKNPYNLVFTQKNGSPVNPTYFSRNFKNQCRRLGFSDRLRVHSTRHTFATNLLQLNVPIPDVQALGGWSSSEMLLRIYAHTVQKSHRKAIQKLVKEFTP